MAIQWDDEPKSNVSWDDEQLDMERKLRQFGSNVLGVTEALGTGLIRAPLAVGAAGGAGLTSLLGGEGLSAAADSATKASAPFMEKGFITDQGKSAMEMLGHGFEKAVEAAGEGFQFAAKNAKYSPLGVLAPNAAKVLEVAPEELTRTLGEAGANAVMNLAMVTGGKGKAKGLSKEAEAELARRQAELQKSATPPESKIVWDEQPLPTLTEQPLHLPEEPIQPTPFPTLNEVPVQPEIPKGTTTFPEQPVPTHPNPLELTPNDAAVPHTPNPQFENVVPRAPDQPMNPGLLDPSIEAQRIKDMQTNTGINQVRSEFPSIDFPLRQEVLQDPKIKAAIDAFREEDAKLQGNPELQAKLREEFAAGMRQLGIDKPQDAYGRGLFESGQGTKLPIEKTNRPALPSSGKQGWTAIVDHEPLAIKNPPKVIRGGRQSGQIHPDLLTFGVSSLLRKLGPEKLLDKFSGTFSPEAIRFANRNTNNPLSRETTVFMPPERFLELAAPRTWGPESSLAKEKHRNIRNVLKTNNGLEGIPYLSTEGGRVIEHEGRHRADIFKELGLDLMPVRIKDRDIRWGKEGKRPDISSLIPEGKSGMAQRFGQRGALDPSVIAEGLTRQAHALSKLTDNLDKIIPRTANIERGADGTPKVLLHGTNSRVAFNELRPGPGDMFVHASTGPVPATIVAARTAGWEHMSEHPWMNVSARELKNHAEQEPWVQTRLSGLLDRNEKALAADTPRGITHPRTMAFTLKKGNYPLIKDLGVWNGYSLVDGMKAAGLLTADQIRVLESKMKNAFDNEWDAIVAAELKKMGIDGFRYHNDYERFGGELTESYAILNPNHLQSVWDGKNSAYSGGKQRGSIGDPEFLKFKESLPEPLKKEASAMYREWLKMQKGKPVEVTPGKTTESAISKIPGMSKIIDEIAPIDERPWKELRDIALNEPEVKMGRMARGLYSGADLAGFAKKSTLIRYVGDAVNNHFRKADVFIRDLLLDKDAGLKPAIDKLSKAEQVQLHEAMKGVEGKDTPLQFDNPKLAEAHKRYRAVMDAVFKNINEVRVSLGMKELPARPNYMPSRWLGDFHIPVTDIHGNFINILTANTRRGARKAAKFMQEKYPEYKFGEVEYKPLTKASGDLETGYRELMNIFGEDDPRVKTIQEAYEQLIQDKGYEFEGFKRHFKAKKAEGVRGFEGDKGWLSPEENARDGFQAGLKYAEQALRWSEVQKAALKIKEVIADKEVGQAHPEAMKYVESYWNRASGKDSMVARAIDSLVDQAAQITGVGRGAIVDTGHVIKKAMTLKFLGFMNMAFLGSQAYQPYQMLGHWMSYLHDRGANANLLVTSNKALMDLVSAPERMTPEGRAAYDWAKKNHIFDSYILDDIRSATSKPWLDATDAVMSWAPNKIEGFSRANFYFNIFHQLHESGITGVEAYKTAAKITDMGMTNYKMHERPLVYRELGAIGDMASSLTTFKHNQYSQLAAMGKEGRRSNLLPMITAQLMAGGLLGFYGRDEIDSLIKFFNEQSANGHWDVPYIPTLREVALKNAFDWAAFGGVSQITGMDMSSRFSAGNIFPDSPVELFFPFYQDIKQMAASAYDVGMKQTGESALKATNAMSPSSLKWITEEFGYRTPSGMYQSPGTGLGSYKRDTGDKVARVLGGWTKEESRDRQSVMEMKGENQWVQTMKKNLTDAYINTNSNEKRAEYARRYSKMGGNPQDLVNALAEKTKQKELSARQRESGLPNITNTNKAFQFLRGKEYPK